MSRAKRVPLPEMKPLDPAELERSIQDENLFRGIIASDQRLPNQLRHPAALPAAGPIAPFSAAWIRKQHEKLALGQLCGEDLEMLHAIEPFVDQELYTACMYDAGPVGWVIADLDSRRVVHWQVTQATPT